MRCGESHVWPPHAQARRAVDPRANRHRLRPPRARRIVRQQRAAAVSRGLFVGEKDEIPGWSFPLTMYSFSIAAGPGSQVKLALLTRSPRATTIFRSPTNGLREWATIILLSTRISFSCQAKLTELRRYRSAR